MNLMNLIWIKLTKFVLIIKINNKIIKMKYKINRMNHTINKIQYKVTKAIKIKNLNLIQEDLFQ